MKYFLYCFIAFVVLRALFVLCASHAIFSLFSALMMLLIFLLYCFLRDPQRTPPAGDFFLAPADGKVLPIKTENNWIKIMIFMNFNNVHVQRVPYPGKVVLIEKVDGPSKRAYLEDAAHNKQVITTIQTRIGNIIVKQLTGIFVRRIITYPEVGEELKAGDRFGCIMFGSRVELWLPADKVEIMVKENQLVTAGITIVARPK